MARRRKKDSSGVWLFVTVLVIAFVVAKNNGSDQPPPPPQETTDPRQLTAQVLALPNDIVLTNASRAALDNYAKGGAAVNFCGDTLPQVDPLLLQVLLKLQSEGYRVLVNNFGLGSDRTQKLCYDKNGNRVHDRHVQLRAVDLNGIVKVGGPQTPWGGLQFQPGPEMQAIQAYSDAWLASQPLNRGGVGQEGCLNGRWRPGGFHVAIPPGSVNPDLASFTDSCSHLHLDVRER
jgi:hypothetical protein